MVCSRRCIVVTIDGALYNVDVDEQQRSETYTGLVHFENILHVLSYKMYMKNTIVLFIWLSNLLTLCFHAIINMRQAQPVWRTKSYDFKREAWVGNVLFFLKYFLKFFLFIWLESSLFDVWLFRSFYLRRSSAENLVERYFLTRILFQVYFDFA